MKVFQISDHFSNSAQHLWWWCCKFNISSLWKTTERSNCLIKLNYFENTWKRNIERQNKKRLKLPKQQFQQAQKLKKETKYVNICQIESMKEQKKTNKAKTNLPYKTNTQQITKKNHLFFFFCYQFTIHCSTHSEF